MTIFRRSGLVLAVCVSYSVIAMADVTVTVGDSSREGVIKINADPASGLDGGVYVLPSMDGAKLTCNDPGAAWSIFDSRGAAYATPVSPTGIDASGAHIITPEGDKGYAVESGGRTTYFWLVDYSRHPFSPGSLTMVQEEGECSRATLICTGEGDEIAVYGITGRRFVIDREINIVYRSVEWSDEQSRYIDTDITLSYPSLRQAMSVEAPYITTAFRLDGDRFLAYWGREEMILSPTYDPFAIDCHTEAIQHSSSTSGSSDDTATSGASNEVINTTPGTLGGSAPVTITFSAEVTDGALFHEWQFSRSPEFDDIYLRAQELEVTHTFSDSGTDYVRLHCTDASGGCDVYSTVYTVSTGESMLKCPNAFTPFNRDGVNDEWRVSYSSIVNFECHIFNRSGHRIVTLTHPSQGWDGRYGGKDVPAGVYYYVIKALGADGRAYNLSGDINILNYK